MLRAARDWWQFRQAVDATRTAAAAPNPGTRDVIVLPCWRRAEFLWHCLDNLTRVQGLDELEILFRPDTGYSADNLEVIREFADRLPHFTIDFPPPCPFRRTKQSANLLLGYLKAAAVARRFVFLIEDDLMIARDYFRWHRAVHEAAGRLFCSIASSNPNRAVAVPAEPEGFYLTSGDYCSIGVCFDQQALRQWVAPHVNMAYFRRPKRYLRRLFPDSRVPLGFAEQDGLLRRIQERSGLPIAYACLPRVFHAGFYGYNRAGGLSGDWRQRVAALREIIYSPEAMRSAASRPEWVDQPVSLEPPEWSRQSQLRDLRGDSASSLLPEVQG
jgi:hypothetical protein